MTPVMQDRFGRGNGNCLQAAVASLLDLPIADVPNFSDAGKTWFEEITIWTKARSIGVVHFGGAPGNGSFIGYGVFGVGIWTVVGSDERHAVVMRFESTPNEDGSWYWEADVAHDPNPRSPTLVKCEEVIFFVRTTW